MLRHLIISEKLKFSYLKNKKTFRIEIKKAFFLVLKVLSFGHTKQNSKNVADRTFKDLFPSKIKTVVNNFYLESY